MRLHQDLEPYAPELTRILVGLGHPEAWVSVDTYMCDFDPDLEAIDHLANTLGVDVYVNDRLINIAERLRHKEQHH